VDKDHANVCKDKINAAYNLRQNFLDKPGQYDCDFIPLATFNLSITQVMLAIKKVWQRRSNR
jgi:hypothetical protein